MVCDVREHRRDHLTSQDLQLRYSVNPSTITYLPVKRSPEPATKASSEASDKYKRILDAAIEVIAEKGFFHSRVSEIANRAGVADGTIYLYFKNKDELLMADIDSAFHGFIGRARLVLGKLTHLNGYLHKMEFLLLVALGRNCNISIVFQAKLRHCTNFIVQLPHN